MRLQFDGHRLSVSLPSFRKPLAHRGRKAYWIDAQPGFEQAFPNGQSVVKLTRASEISHTEGVQPLEWHGFPLASNHNFRR